MIRDDEQITEGSTARISVYLQRKNPATGALEDVLDAESVNIEVLNPAQVIIADRHLSEETPPNPLTGVVNEGEGMYATMVTMGGPGRYRARAFCRTSEGFQINELRKWTVYPLQ